MWQAKADLSEHTASLQDKLEWAGVWDGVLEFAVSMVHPAAAFAIALKAVGTEYEITGTISWSSGLMLAASVVGMKGTGIFGEAAMGSKILTGFEMTTGFVLAGKGAYDINRAIASGENIGPAIANAALLFVPYVHTLIQPRVGTYISARSRSMWTP